MSEVFRGFGDDADDTNNNSSNNKSNMVRSSSLRVIADAPPTFDFFSSDAAPGAKPAAIASSAAGVTSTSSPLRVIKPAADVVVTQFAGFGDTAPSPARSKFVPTTAPPTATVGVFDSFGGTGGDSDGGFFAAVAAKNSPVPPVRTVPRVAAEPLPTIDAFGSASTGSGGASDPFSSLFNAPSTPSVADVRAAIHSFVPTPSSADAPPTPEVRAAISSFLQADEASAPPPPQQIAQQQPDDDQPVHDGSISLASSAIELPSSPKPVSRRLVLDHDEEREVSDTDDQAGDWDNGIIFDQDDATGVVAAVGESSVAAVEAVAAPRQADDGDGDDDDDDGVIDGEADGARDRDGDEDNRSFGTNVSVIADDESVRVVSSSMAHSTTSNEAADSVPVFDAFSSVQDDSSLLFSSLVNRHDLSTSSVVATASSTMLSSSTDSFSASGHAVFDAFSAPANVAQPVDAAPVFSGFTSDHTSPTTVNDDVAFFAQVGKVTVPQQQQQQIHPQVQSQPQQQHPIVPAFVPAAVPAQPQHVVSAQPQPVVPSAREISRSVLSESVTTSYSLAESIPFGDDPFSNAFANSSDSTFFDLVSSQPASVAAPVHVPFVASSQTTPPSSFVPSSFVPQQQSQPEPVVQPAPVAQPQTQPAPVTQPVPQQPQPAAVQPRAVTQQHSQQPNDGVTASRRTSAPRAAAPVPSAFMPSGFMPMTTSAPAALPVAETAPAIATIDAFDNSSAFVLDLGQSVKPTTVVPAVAPVATAVASAVAAASPLPHAEPSKPRHSYSRDGRPAHAFGGFAFGGRLVTTFVGRGSPRVSIVPVAHALKSTAYFQSFARFPGPLVYAKRNAVLAYIDSAIAEADRDADRVLLWRVLRLMVDKQASLLANDDTLKALVALLVDERVDAHPLTTTTATPPAPDVLDRIQQAVVRGDLQRAHAMAVEHGVWQHALVLASHVGADAYRDTVARFVRAELPVGAPLHTLYSAMSGQAGALLKGEIKPDLLSSWRSNVAALLANHVKGAPSLVGTLGDQLWASARRHRAAHVCYLITERPFGAELDPNARVVLLGADHKMRTRFAVADPGPEAWRMSEVLLYVGQQANSQHNAPTLLHYRLIYAQMCADVGLLQQAQAHTALLIEAVRESPDQLAWLAPMVETLRDRVDDMLGTRSSIERKGSWLSIGGVFKQSTGVFNKFAALLVAGDSDAGGAESPPPPSSQQQQQQASHQPPQHRHQAPPSQQQARPQPQRPAVASQPSSFMPAMSTAPAVAPVQAAPIAAVATSTPTAAVASPAPSTRSGYMMDDDDDDFVTKPARAAQPSAAATSSPASQASAAATSATDSPSEGGFVKSMFSMFSRQKKTKQADLGKQLEFEYNKEYGVWLRKGEKPDPSLLAGIAPPPTWSPMDPSPAAPNNERAHSAPVVAAASIVTPPGVSAPAPAAAAPGAGAGGVPPMPSLGDSGNKFSKGRQRRYIDTMNNGVVHSSNPTSNGLIFEKPAAPVGGAAPPASMSGFTPTAFVPTAASAAAAMSTFEPASGEATENSNASE